MLRPPLAKQDITVAAAIFATMFCVYFLSAWPFKQPPSPDNAYFNDLAVSFLHGHLSLSNPIQTRDLTLYNGKWYVAFPPLPAILMLPSVAAFGNINTVLFSIIFGALNVTLVFLLLSSMTTAKWVRLQLLDRLWLTTLFGLGSVHWYMATVGSVWSVSQINTITLSAMSLWLAVAVRAPLLGGLALATAMWARPHIVLLYPLIIAVGYQHADTMDPASKRSFLIRWGWRSIAPLCLSVLGLLLYNWLRFDNLFDFGYLTQNVSRRLRQDLSIYGQFNLHFVFRNLWTMLLAPPRWDGESHWFVLRPQGMSVFLTSPALLYLVRARQCSAVVCGAWLSVLACLVPLLTYYNTGWSQFGYRFSLDFMIVLIMLLAYSIQGRVSIPMRLLIIIGVGVNFWGQRWFANL